ncbi:MAG: hypothetical protein H6837_13885 [Planctomycetes bacterium]|nr:hypothetical protein [Planctomycetota bacterium]
MRWLLLAALGACCAAPPQPPPLPPIPPGENPHRWATAIAEFETADRAAPVEPGKVVFAGSSSIRLWHTLERDMAPLPVVHRGFGGAKLFDLLYYADTLISRHRPSVVVLFCGTNDLDRTQAKTPEQVCTLFQRIVARLHAADASLTIVYIAITPTLARDNRIEQVRDANRRIRDVCATDRRLEFVDPSPALMDAAGRPDPKWFQRDRLHLNAEGYRVWTRYIRPVVLRLFERARR